MEVVCQCRPYRAKKADDHADRIRWEKPVESRDDGRSRFPLSFRWPREHHSALEFVVARTSARRVALAALRNWRRRKEFADAVISSALSKAELHSADRAFAVELFYGVVPYAQLLVLC